MNEPLRCISDEELQGYVDERLDAERRSRVERYLQAHPDVADRVAAYRAQREGLREALAPLAEAPLPASLNLSRLVEARLRPSRTPWRLAAAVALGIGLGGAGYGLLNGRQPAGRELDALVADAAVSYAVFVPDLQRPVEIPAARRDELSNWVASRLDRKLPTPDLTAAGYRLLGGRVVATAHGPAVLFVFEDSRGTRLAVFARPTPAADTAAIKEVDVGPLDGCAWIERGIGYTVTGNEPYARLLELAKDVRSQAQRPG